jgi:hypothetical protein
MAQHLHTAPQVELVSIFEGLAQLKSVKQLFIKKIVNLPAQALANVLSSQTQLKFLYLQNIKLSGEEGDFATLANALQSHPNLRKTRLYMCRPSIRTSVTFDSIISALSKIPTLEEVTIIHSKISTEEQEWDGTCLTDLCRSKSIKILTLTFDTELRDAHIEAMAEALETNETLKHISIRANTLGTSAGMAMGKVLNTNRTLERLRVQLSSDEFAAPIVDALHKNKYLQKLGLILPSNVNERVREQFTKEMASMLRKSNYNLQDMDLVGWKANAAVRFYLKANKAGRRSLLAEGGSREQWAKILVAHKDDISIMYYFLKRNPQLCLAALRQMMYLTSERKRNSPVESSDQEKVAVKKIKLS